MTQNRTRQNQDAEELSRDSVAGEHFNETFDRYSPAAAFVLLPLAELLKVHNATRFRDVKYYTFKWLKAFLGPKPVKEVKSFCQITFRSRQQTRRFRKTFGLIASMDVKKTSWGPPLHDPN